MSDDDRDDFRLLDEWGAGGEEAGRVLFRRHYAAVFRFLARKVEQDVEEVVQETFLICLQKRASFRRESSFVTFLFSIARLVLHESWRRRRRQGEQLDFEEVSIASLSTSAGTKLAKHEARTRLLWALNQLPLDQQLLLELFYWEQLDGHSIAQVFDVAPTTVRTRLYRAKEALRAKLELAETDGTMATPALPADFDAWATALSPQAMSDPLHRPTLGNNVPTEDATET